MGCMSKLGGEERGERREGRGGLRSANHGVLDDGSAGLESES